MIKARVGTLRYNWLVGIFLLYVKSVESQPVPPGQNVLLSKADKSREFMRYCDHEKPIYDQDTFFNRIVAINKRNFASGNGTYPSQLVAPGVYINRNHVLTSYTPFRRIASTDDKLKEDRDLSEFYITHYKGKLLNADRSFKGYLLETVDVTCGRQIFPNSSTDFVQAEKFLHFPNYDLMVFQTEGMRDFLTESMAYPVVDTVNQQGILVLGPQLTELPKFNDLIGDKLKIVSLGMIDLDHIYNRNHLHSVTLETNDRLLEDCDEWFDEVNKFICIKNVDEHIGIGSGAFLFNGNAVIGVGCFTIQKGIESVHVFTDVRNVLSLITSTCTEFDGYGIPTTTTTDLITTTQDSKPV